MENQFAKRISSMFSISTSSSEQSNNTPTPHARLNPAGISRISSPTNQVSTIPRSDVVQPGVGQTQFLRQDEDSAAQPDLLCTPMSPNGAPNGVVASPDELSPPILKPLSPPCSPSSPVGETKLESRLVSGSQSGPEGDSKGRSASRIRRACGVSRAESKEGTTRPTSPSKLLNAPNPSERRKSARKSWLPGKSRTHSPSGSAVPLPPQAWLVGSEAKVSYDVSRLVNFQEVSNGFRERDGSAKAHNIPGRFPNCGMEGVTPWYTCIQESRAKALPSRFPRLRSQLPGN